MSHTSRRHLPALREPARLDAAWIKFLLLEGLGDDEIRERLVSDDLGDISPDDLAKFRSTLVIPTNFTPGAVESHLASQAFVLGHKIGVFFRADGSIAQDVLRLLRSARARELTEAALLVEPPMAAIRETLRRYVGVETTAEVIATYRDVFFNTSGLARAQVRALVAERVRQAVVRVAGDGPASRRAVSSDPRVLAASLPHSTVSWASTMLALGYSVAQQNVAATASEIANVAMLRAAEAVVRGDPDDARRAEAFASVVERMRAIKASSSTPTDALTRAFGQLRLVQSNEPMPTVDALLEQGDEIGTLGEGPADESDNGVDDEEKKHVRRS